MPSSLFPQDDFSLIGVVLGLPLLGAFVNGVFGKRLGKSAVRLMTLAVIGLSFLAALFTFFQLNAAVDASSVPGIGEHGAAHHGHVRLSWLAWEWMRTSGVHNAKVPIDLKFSVDALSGVMMLVVTGVGFLIHVYATSYMADDEGFARFFAYLNLFVFSMLVLILGDNLAVLFIGWEGVGLCSYLLIGFWYGKMPNAAAGKKAFIANRIGDFGLIVAMFLLVYYTGALDWGGIEGHTTYLMTPDAIDQVHIWPIGIAEFRDIDLGILKLPLHFLQPDTPKTLTAATAIGLALFLGCTGKSAQIPLYVWLPDAMAGPTPVSALIHAATMVTAGIYLVCRLSFVFVLSPAVMTTIALTGACTAFLAATIALVQNDIKKVLAYSTVSQLGFMFIGVGVGAFTAGFFHVFTHAFFKACLFLGAGSVIHAMHSRIHDDDRSQDMRNMGGLRKTMPLTFWTFAASTLAIIGFPLTSGFFSKDEILARALVNVIPAASKATWTPPTWVPWLIWGLGIVAATMTSFYMVRCLILTFFGEFRGWTVGRPSKIPAHRDGDHDHGDHHEEDLAQPGAAPHESPRAMTIPLVILGALAILAGVLNPSALKLFSHGFDFLPIEKWLSPVFEQAESVVKTVEEHDASSREWVSAAGAFLAFAIGSAIAYWMYVLQAGKPARDLARAFPRLHKWAYDKWYVDEAYDKTVGSAADALSDTATSIDQGVIDLLLARVTALLVSALGTILRVAQNGVVHVYAAVMVIGLAALGWFFVSPHPDFSVAQNAAGDFVLHAAPGPGYGYRWSSDAAKAPDLKDFSGTDELKLKIDEGKTRTVKLEVINAFGRVGTKEMVIEHPRPDDAFQVTQQPSRNPTRPHQ